MTHADPTRSAAPRSEQLAAPFAEIDLCRVLGGANLDFDAIRRKAEPYCPSTAAKYAHVDSAPVNRSLALRVGNECLAEMGSFQAAFARGPILRAIDQAFPR